MLGKHIDIKQSKPLNNKKQKNLLYDNQKQTPPLLCQTRFTKGQRAAERNKSQYNKKSIKLTTSYW